MRQGIVYHSKPTGDFLDQDLAEDLTLEGRILRVADSVAYLNHDIADAIRGGILEADDLPAEVNETLGTTHSQRINTLVTDVVGASWDASGDGTQCPDVTPPITMNPLVRRAANLLREFMFQEVYLPLGRNQESEVAREMVGLLFQHFLESPEEVPPSYLRHEEDERQAVVDYISGMTDHYAIRQAESLQPGISSGVFSRVPLA